MFKGIKLWILLSLLVLVFTGILFKARLSSDIMALLPMDDPVIKKQFSILSAMGSLDKTILEVSGGDSLPFETLSQISDSINQILTQDSVFHFNNGITPESFFGLRNALISNFPMLFTTQDSLYCAERMNPDSLDAMLDRTVSSLFTFATTSADSYLMKNDPFGFHPIILSKLATFNPSPSITIEEGKLTNHQKTRIISFADSKPNVTEKQLKSVIAKATELAQRNGALFSWMSATRATIDNSTQIKKDINLTLPITILLIILICFTVYTRPHYGLITFVPTVLGILFTFALFSLTGRFSLILIGFGAALMGITVDFAIHYLYHCEQTGSTDPSFVRKPILASALTTAAAFLVLAASKIPALTQLGLITAVGITVTAIITITILPRLISTPTKSRKKNSIFLPLFVKLYRDEKTIPFAALLFIASTLTWIFASDLTFDGSPDSMNGMSKETLACEQSLYANWPGIGSSTYLATTHNDFDTLIQQVEGRIDPLIARLSPHTSSGPRTSFASILPSKTMQEKNRARFVALFNTTNISRMHESATRICTRYGLPFESFDSYFHSLKNPGAASYPLTLQSYPVSFVNGVLKNSIVHDGNRWVAAVALVEDTTRSWSVLASHADSAGVIAVNDALLGKRIVELIKEAFLTSAGAVPIAVLLILIVTIRSPRGITAVFIPTICAAGITLGSMSLFGIQVNIVTMMVFAFVFGLGIDYSLFMYYSSIAPNCKKDSTTANGALSVSVAALTTLAGLGILAFAGHPVLSTLGKTGLIGIFASLLCSLVMVPAIVFVTGKNR